MIYATSSDGTVNEPITPVRRRSDLPPSYAAAEAEPHGFIDGKVTRKTPSQDPPELLVPGGVSFDNPSTQNDVRWDSETTLFLDPAIGKPSVACMAPDESLAQCARHRHVKRTKYSCCGIISAVLFFPWGLFCLMGSRLVYCERCGLILRDPHKHRDMRREQQCGRHPSKSRCCRQRAQRQHRRL